MTRKFCLIAVITVIALVVGLVGYNAAFADITDPSDGKISYYQQFVAKLAANLGLDQEKVTAAIDTTRRQLLDEAVQEGRLTQEQADKMAKLKGFGPAGPGWHQMGKKPQPFRNNLDDAITSTLGLTPQELREKIKSGQTLDQIVAEFNLTMEQFKEKLLTYEKDQIAQKVADGKLTQEKADSLIKFIEKQIANFGNIKAKDKKPTN